MEENPLFNLDEDGWQIYKDDPLPGWGSRSFTLFDTASKQLASRLEPETTAVFSVPFDTTASTRVGARYGPRAIREASLAYSSQLQSRGSINLRNMRTGYIHKTKHPELVDLGDFHVYPSDPYKQMKVTAEETFRLALNSSRVIMLGGEHSLSFPAFCGVEAAIYAKKGGSLGYLQIDNHFDFGDSSVLHGKFYHGSNARRISEHPRMSPQAIGFVGMGDLTSQAQYDALLNAGVSIQSIADIHQRGFEVCLRTVLDRMTSVVDAIYVSLDIDVCDTATATGTGHVTIGGISATEFLSIASILQEYPVIALDIMEVSPHLDSSSATPHIAARFLFEWLFLERVYDA